MQKLPRINVLHVITGLPLGGAESIVYTLAKNADRSRFNFIFCCLDDEGHLAKEIKKESLEVFCLREERYRFAWRQFYNLYRLIKKKKIDIVHTHLYKADFWGRLVAWAAGVPVICKSEHTVSHPMRLGVWSAIRPPFYNIMKILGMNRFLDANTNAVIYDTNYARSSFLGNKFDSGKHHVVSGGVSVSRLDVREDKAELRLKLGVAQEDFFVIIAGRLMERKGHRYLFEAFSTLTGNYPNLKLLVVGGGPLENDLKVLTQRLGINERVIFTGKVENAPEYIKASDLLVLPSWREALGLVFLEAMYLGVPVIGANEAGIPEVIKDGVNGYLVKVKDPVSIREAILKVLNNPVQVKNMVERGRERFNSEFSEEKFTRKYEDIYIDSLRFKGLKVEGLKNLAERKENNLRVMFFGDLVLNQRGIPQGVFREVSKLFEEADLVIGNLESPLPGSAENHLKIPRVIADAGSFKNITRLGADVFCLANNHAYDALEDGYLKTVDYLKNNSMLYLGAGLSAEEAARPLIIERNGFRISILNYLGKDTNPCLPEDSKIKLNFFDLDRAASELNDLKNKTDLRIVVLHWGREYTYQPTDKQRSVARWLCDSGADAVVGHHTHIIQPVERYKNSVIAYGLGNFYFPDIWFGGRWHRKWQASARQSIILDAVFFQKGLKEIDLHKTMKRNMVLQLERSCKIKEKRIHLGYVLDSYPKDAPTFIVNEIVDMREHGYQVSLFSVYRTKGLAKNSVVLPDVNLVYAKNTLAILAAHLNFLLRSPRKYLWLLKNNRSYGGKKIFYKGVYFAHKAAVLGVKQLHAHFAWDAAYIARLISYLTGIPYSLSIHARDLYVEAERLKEKIVDAKFVVTCVKDNKLRLLNRFGRKLEDKIAVIYHGVNTELFKPAPCGEEDVDILSVGRLVEKKGFKYLVRALGILKREGMKTRCAIVGAPEKGFLKEYEDFKKEIEREDLEENIKIIAPMPAKELVEHYRRAKIFALPCIVDGTGDRDGIPNVLAEAMAMEKAVVSTNSENIREIVTHKKEGILIGEKDAEALALSLKKLLGDQDYRKSLGRAAREKIVKDFDSQRHIKDLICLFEANR